MSIAKFILIGTGILATFTLLALLFRGGRDFSPQMDSRPSIEEPARALSILTIENLKMDEGAYKYDDGEDFAIIAVPEVRPWSIDPDAEAEDLNGDGDLYDNVVHLWDLRTGKMVNTRLAGLPRYVNRKTGIAVIAVSESSQGKRDLTGDHDIGDVVLHLIRFQ